MYDLKKVEQKFHEFLRTGLNEEIYRINEIKITAKLFEQEEAFYIPYGWISYFLVIDDEEPVIYANIISRMDLSILVIINEKEYEDYDAWEGGNEEIWKKYRSHSKKIKRFDYDDLMFISDIENE